MTTLGQLMRDKLLPLVSLLTLQVKVPALPPPLSTDGRRSLRVVVYADAASGPVRKDMLQNLRHATHAKERA
ncbi:uncharacterized protein LY79DRAFT_559252 [Colletotrichum navitas]|uniref:Uncharacterized protein n=1 Tax=Colletotrichum navitas TaxID=681940 RepID=A0AAD8PVS4_9PEZI|nr:uncharacterized protein LY79DRAFT_559252 [Colletotrichum navitas]KAK1585118.1 hypothetical protein LY79DRAFT_559252 [Colletotrichum navitas]